ncbi:rapamycin-insensitive companion of mTOR-like [Octopus vulgaris]|uniref:Rapamycin-insensitive companion of mTOR-like n=1 Tax=Octopus vulgaris TaxID=6645 RepID=A0AA36FMF8_OCTVU|nr:rapamycin-insensitive companion of mTOR-like [Octopus vulgaris]
MAAFAVRHPSRALKNGRLRGRHESGEENIRLDLSRAPSENVKEVLSNVVCQNGISKNKKLGYLNFFVKLLNKLGPSKNLGYTMEEILCCLKVGLLHEAKEVRAATLRVIRYLLTEQKVLDIIVSLHIDYLIARCLDICLSNEVERIHAMKLIRKIIQLFPHQVPLSMLYPMVAIGRDGSSERDRLRRACLATICELAFVNAQAADRCDAISCILRNILDCYHYPRINESLVVTVLFLLNHPNTRHYIKQNTDLEQLIAPFTDCHFKFSAETNEHGTGDEQETRFKASKMALLTVMRSWPGLIRMCRPTGSGLQSLIGILYIQNNEIRQAIMDVMFDLFRLTTPKLTDSFVEALNSVDPSAMREEWKLLEGFVAEEGRAILPHLAKVRPNLIENHLALILAAWIETGILQALVEVITSTEGHLFIRAVILLGELLHMANTLLPHECTTHSHCLPNLMAVASSFDIPGQHRHRATLAVSYLNRIHTLKKRGPRPCSLFLDQLIQNANTTLQQESFYTQFSQDKLSSDAVKTVFNADDFVSQVIRETHVLSTKEHKSWDWHSISALLKCPDKFKKLDDQTSQRFVRRLLSFFKPTSGQYSSIEQKHPAARKITVACCHFIDFLIETDVEETNKLIVEFLGDINNCLSEMKSERAISDSIFSPTLINNTLSKYYFLFIGRFSATDRGEQCLQRAGIFQSICDVISASTPDVYIKLIVSSMYYARDCSTKVILSKALVSSSENGRLYATKFLRVLLRTKMPMFRSWGMEVLVTQLYDQSRAVAMAALNVIDEACEIQGHIGMSTYGIVWLKEEGLVTEIIRLAEECGVFSVRGILRNMSSSSLQDFEVQHSSPYSTMSKSAQTIPRLGSVHAEFVGLCLPVDINMLFEVVEGEDRRSNSMSSTHSPPTDRKSTTKPSDYSKMPKLSVSAGCDEPEQHLPQNCLMCCHLQRLDGAASQTVSINITDLDNNISYLDTVLPISSELTGSSQKVLESSSNSPTPTIEPTQTRLIEARSNSHDASWVTPSSITSNTSTESATKKLTDDSPFGKTQIRKEILKFVVNLSSSVGLKMSEQGLLSSWRDHR